MSLREGDVGHDIITLAQNVITSDVDNVHQSHLPLHATFNQLQAPELTAKKATVC